MNELVAIVTGGATGLGREIAAALSGTGCRVCVNYYSSHEAAEKLVGELGNEAVAIRADVGMYEEVAAMIRTVVGKWGRLDVVVNNAGITKDALLLKQGEDDWDSVLEVNLKGVFNVTRACIPFMKRGGHIVNISSYSGLKGKRGQAAYSASKAAVLGMTKSAALELAGQGISVNAVLPGFMPTRMGSAAAAAIGKAKEESLLHTLSDPREVARFIAYLVTTRTVTGQTFVFDSRIV